MVHTVTLSAVAALALSLVSSASAEGLYHKQSPVIQVNAKSYDRLIAKSNHTSIVEFYAPWCGHCKNLQPQWEKAARGLAGLAKVAAVNCDEDENKQFCGTMGVQGFPTLKIVKPGKKFGRPIVEDYQGPREAKDIIDAVIAKIPNHVKKVTDKDVATLEADTDVPKAILFTEKGATSALWKAVAVDFLGSITVAQIRNKEKESVEKYGITKFPTVILIPAGEGATPIVYDGALKKAALVEFLSRVATPNPDPAPAKITMPKSKTTKKSAATKKAESKAKESFESASSSHAKSEASEAKSTPGFATTTKLDEGIPTPDTKAEEVDWDKAQKEAKHAATLSKLETDEALYEACFLPRFGTCLLVFTSNSDQASADATAALQNLAEVAHRYWTIGHKMFPFYNVPDIKDEAHYMRKSLNLEKNVEVIAINRKREWYRRYTGSDYSLEAMDNFVNQVRMGDTPKLQLSGTFLNEKIFGHEQKPLGEIPLEKTAGVKVGDKHTEAVVEGDTVVAAEDPVPGEEVPTAAKVVETETETPTTETQTGEATTITQSVASVAAQTTAEAATPEPAEPELKKDEL